MQYIPRVTEKEKKENHQHFSERRALYKKKGFDFEASRKFILQKAGVLSGNILEIGTGYGDTAIALAKVGYKITTIDKDIESFKIAAPNLAWENLLSNIIFYIMDGETLSFKKESFNNVVCVNLFHHIKRVAQILSEMDRVLCKGGKLVLADFNEKGMGIVNGVHRDEGRVHENFGISRDYVYSYLQKSGYKIKKYEEQFHWVLISEKQ